MLRNIYLTCKQIFCYTLDENHKFPPKNAVKTYYYLYLANALLFCTLNKC